VYLPLFWLSKRVNRRKIAGYGGGIVELIDLAGVVRRRRLALSLTQLELADLAEVSERLIRDLETGRLTIRTDKLLAILTVLGLEFNINRIHADS